MNDDEIDLTVWVERMKDNDARAFEQVWEAFFDRLAHYAKRKLGDSHRRDYDEDDAALSAMNSLFRGVRDKRFENLRNSEDLWRLLVTIGRRKVRAQIRKRFSEKRGGGTAGETVSLDRDDDAPAGFDQLMRVNPGTALEIAVGEEIEELISKTGDQDTGRVLILKLEGYSNEEIVQQTGCSLRSVERKLARLRQAIGGAPPQPGQAKSSHDCFGQPHGRGNSP